MPEKKTPTVYTLSVNKSKTNSYKNRREKENEYREEKVEAGLHTFWSLSSSNFSSLFSYTLQICFQMLHVASCFSSPASFRKNPAQCCVPCRELGIS